MIRNNTGVRKSNGEKNEDYNPHYCSPDRVFPKQQMRSEPAQNKERKHDRERIPQGRRRRARYSGRAGRISGLSGNRLMRRGQPPIESS
jgi:hypothetical protein